MSEPTPDNETPDAPANQPEDLLAARQRVIELETQLESQRDQLATAEAQRDELNTRLTRTENRSTLQRLLEQAGTVDVETACLLIGRSVDLDEPQDARQLEQAVQQLLLNKPFLQGQSGGGLPPTTRSGHDGQGDDLTTVARRATATGNRKDIAEYLRLRRQMDAASPL